MSLLSLVLEFFRGKIRQIDREMGGAGHEQGSSMDDYRVSSGRSRRVGVSHSGNLVSAETLVSN
jgi:hypothetical protein